MPGPRSPFSTRTLAVSVAFVAASIGWSTHWSDCKYQAAFHETLANADRQPRPGEGLNEQARKRRNVEWHDEMRRRFEKAAWLPWPRFDRRTPSALRGKWITR